ncbi:MAG: hypothetical protein WCI71_12405, partial [Bacteroidota bacterium]
MKNPFYDLRFTIYDLRFILYASSSIPQIYKISESYLPTVFLIQSPVSSRALGAMVSSILEYSS